MKGLMKKGFLYGMTVGLVLPVVAFSASLMKNPTTLQYLDIELPFRCSVTSDSEEELTSSVALSKLDFTVRLPGQTGLLPRYQVNGFSFNQKTVDKAVSELVKSAGISVVAEDGKYATLSAQDLNGELSSVLEKLVREGNAFYTYQTESRTLFLTHKAKALIQVPNNKLVMMAVLDALNGGHFEPISIDWENYQITLFLTRPELKEVRSLMASLIKQKYILAVQVKLYNVFSMHGRSHWQGVLGKLGTRGISVAQNGVVGQAFSLSSKTSENVFLSAMQGLFSYNLVAMGRVVVPSGWRTRFNFNQCSTYMPYENLSLFLKTSIKKKNEAQTVLTLDSQGGEIASFDIKNALDQRIMVVGVPVPGQNNEEMMMSLQFQFIQLIRKGEQNG